MSADGTGARRLTDELAEEGDPAWSPDGRWIAYTTARPGATIREIWVVRPDGTGRHGVTTLGATALRPAWSPDGEAPRLLGATPDSARYEIYTIGVDGKDLRRARTAPSRRVRARVVAGRERR